ncbi:MAG TPA: hypothetical protein EYH45_05605 [Candidatus Caldiarchaeum subterraneum]|uniref:THUMP domain-containing protein n=1 Tax=Caldiarchaeum subterraneum TaxID=311458 RepID=A0A832ZW80_CALS0|nr:hypothetical protein [Candidatus Caldarchaeum subterraneum]
MKKPSFFLLSGEAPELAYGEIKSIHRLLGEPSVKLLEKRIVLSELRSRTAAVEIVGRAAYTKLGGFIIKQGLLTDIYDDITQITREDLNDLISDAVTFRVKVKRIEGTLIDSMQVERKLAEKILKLCRRVSIDLSNPEKIVIVIAYGSLYVVGTVEAFKKQGEFEARRPKRRPFKLPSALMPKLARCMVNLAVRSYGDKILDPFAGTGSIVIEASLLGHVNVGLEIKDWIVEGALANVRWLSLDSELIQADASLPPLRCCFDAAVTDPPYGRSTSIPKKSFVDLIEIFFSNLDTLLKEDGLTCIAYPRAYPVDEIASSNGYRIVESYEVYVHRSLTRVISVFES